MLLELPLQLKNNNSLLNYRKDMFENIFFCSYNNRQTSFRWIENLIDPNTCLFSVLLQQQSPDNVTK